MGQALFFMKRPLRSFNIVNRTEKVLLKEKPTPAPQYPATKQQQEIVNKLYPDILETIKKKNIQLDKHLKSVYVVSNDPVNKSEVATSIRPLPQDKGYPPVFEYGFKDSLIVSEGKCSLKDALIFLTKNSENSEYSAEKIALEYKLNQDVVENILQHFRVPKLYDNTKEEFKLNHIEKE